MTYKYFGTITMDEAWQKVRAGRDYWLEKRVDFYQSKPLLYNSLTDEQKTELATYRQALLDFPATLATIVGDELPLGFGQYYPDVPTWMD